MGFGFVVGSSSDLGSVVDALMNVGKVRKIAVL